VFSEGGGGGGRKSLKVLQVEDSHFKACFGPISIKFVFKMKKNMR